MDRRLILLVFFLATCSSVPMSFVGDMDSGTDTDTDEDSDGGDTDFDSDSGGDTDGDTGGDSDGDSDLDSESDSSSGTGDADADTDTDTDTDADSDGDSDTDVDTDSDTDTDSDADPCDPDCDPPGCWAYDCSPLYCAIGPVWGACDQVLDSPVDCIFDVKQSRRSDIAVFLPAYEEMSWKCHKCDGVIQWYDRVQPGAVCMRVRVDPGRRVVSENSQCDDNLECEVIYPRTYWWAVSDVRTPGWMYVDANEGDSCELECE